MIEISRHKTKTPLWFRQSLRNTGWLLVHNRPWTRRWWCVLLGICPYCQRRDCVD